MPAIAPQLTPAPRCLHRASGSVDLDGGVRLEAGTLSSREVAVIRARLEEMALRVADTATVRLEFSLGAPLPDAVPGTAEGEYYQLDVAPERVVVRARAWAGLLWGVHTLAQLVRQARREGALRALHIRDWPDLPHRGLFMEDKWGPDRMGRDDWFRLVDRMAGLKMNRLGIGLYGCWGSCRYEPGPTGRGWPTEFLMVPIPGHPELRSPKRLRWYSPRAGRWQDETYLPRLFAEDFLADLVQYARDHGITVIPFVNSLGHNTLLPRLMPRISARDEQGTPLGIGYCLSSPETRNFIQTFYTTIVQRYFGGHAPFFHIQMDEVWADHADPQDALRSVEPWCQCEQCRSKKRERLLQDYVVWLADMLTSNGVDQVVMWNDQLTRHMDALDQSFVQQLRAQGLNDRLILHWWWYSNDALNDRTRVAIGRRQGLRGWVAPMSCYYNWQMYTPRLPNIELMLRMAHDEGAEGAVAYAVPDPGWTDHDALLAAYAWNADGMPVWEQQVSTWAHGQFGAAAPRYLAAVAQLRSAAGTAPLGTCYAYTYTYARPESAFPRAYPGEALEALSRVADAAAQLRTAADLAASAEQELTRLAGEPGMDDAIVLSLAGEAARIRGVARTFAFLVELHAHPESAGTERARQCGRVRQELVDAMAQVERGKPAWVVPASLQGLSMLLGFLDQLELELRQVEEDERQASAASVPSAILHWNLVEPYAEEVDDAE